jgi:glutathione S-transferase
VDVYKLFYFPENASLAPHLVLTEMGLSFELVLVDRESNEQKSKEYLLLNPTGRIPALSYENKVIFESAAICLCLCERHPDVSLTPSISSGERDKFYQWLFYLNSTIQPELMVYFYPQKHTNGKETKEIAMAQESRITEMFSLIDEMLEGREFLVGSNITVCDYFLFMLSHWASGFTRPPISFKNLGPYLRNIAKREAVLTVCNREEISLEIYK